jgi:hypothetical protein
MARMGMMPHRRIGRARLFDVFNNTTGAVVARALAADQVVSSYLTSLTEEQVIDGVATRSFIDSNNYRCCAHMSISG